MKEMIFIDKGTEEVLVIDGVVIRVDQLTAGRLLELLKEHNKIDISLVSYDEYVKSNEDVR